MLKLKYGLQMALFSFFTNSLAYSYLYSPPEHIWQGIDHVQNLMVDEVNENNDDDRGYAEPPANNMVVIPQEEGKTPLIKGCETTNFTDVCVGN